MKKFIFRANFEFSAEDLNDAFSLLSEHFLKMKKGEDSSLIEVGDIHLHLKESEEDERVLD